MGTLYNGGFMNKKKLENFRKILLMYKTRILNGGILTSNEDLTISSDDLPDEADLAFSTINQQVSFNIRQKELEKLRAIEEALQKIEKNTYGYCEECEEAIPEKGLQVYPWATLCIYHAEEEEREKSKFKKVV